MKMMINGFLNSQARWYGEIVKLLYICVKCANVRTLVYKMQVRLGESLWSICMKQHFSF